VRKAGIRKAAREGMEGGKEGGREGRRDGGRDVPSPRRGRLRQCRAFFPVGVSRMDEKGED